MTETSELTEGAPFGLLRGAGRDDGMDIVAPHLEDPPGRGDFAVVPGTDGALILRIMRAYPTGSFEAASERGADYLAQLARQPAEVPARVRELLLRFRVEVAPLGWLRLGERWRFEAGVRAIQLFGSPVWRPSQKLLDFLANPGIEEERDRDARRVVRIGEMARGHDVLEDVPVCFSIDRLKGRRTFIFARAGYGKSNLTKLLLSRIYRAPPDVGLLIVDPEGEYAFSQPGQSGRRIPGLADDPALRDRTLVYTDRDLAAKHIAGRLRIDVAQLSPGEFVNAFVPQEKQGQVWVNLLRSCSRGAWHELIELLRTRGYGIDDNDFARVLKGGAKRKSEGNVSFDAIRNNVVPLINQLDQAGSDLIDRSRNHLFGVGTNHPGVVILDVSTLGARDADTIVRVLLNSLFRHAVADFTGGSQRTRGVLLAIEEAQSIFGGRNLDDQDIYVRWVKEGRKYGLGAILITQQPGAIAQELVSQGDNFFVMHLLAQRDLDVLGAANAHFTPEIRAFIRDEPVRGNCYFWSAPDQPYVVAARVDSFDEQIPDIPPPPRARAATPAPTSYEHLLLDGVVRAIAADARVFVYAVAKVDGKAVKDAIAFAPAYLVGWLVHATRLQELQPGDWQEQFERATLRLSALERLLLESNLAREPFRCVGTVEDRQRSMLMISASRLRHEAQQRGLAVKPPRASVNLSSQSAHTPRGK